MTQQSTQGINRQGLDQDFEAEEARKSNLILTAQLRPDCLTLFRPLCYKDPEIDNSRGDLRQLAPRKKTAKEPLGFREIFSKTLRTLKARGF